MTRPLRTVTVIGTGLIGTSIALAATARGMAVHLRDTRAEALCIAEAIGAGSARRPPEPTDLAVVAVPPNNVCAALAEAQRHGLAHHYTDVASVKGLPGGDYDRSRFIGGHPIAGREYSGPGAARADLFAAKPWVLTPTASTSPGTERAARTLVELCGARPVTMTAAHHDEVIALTSHLPHLLASLLAARLRGVDRADLVLAGSGLRDVTRIADGDPDLWTDILGANARSVHAEARDLARDLNAAVDVLADLAEAPDRGTATTAEVARKWLTRLLEEGRTGRAALPARYGAESCPSRALRVRLTDREGELAALLADISTCRVNVEDLRLYGTPEPSSGVAELTVDAVGAAVLTERLRLRGWAVL